MVWIELNVTQLLIIGGLVGFLIAYFVFMWMIDFFKRNKECDKCHGRGYIKRVKK